MIHEVGNVELCEPLDIEPKAQCKVWLSYWDVGIVYCTCGHFLRDGTEENKKVVKYTLDLFSIPNYHIKKGRHHWHRYGKKSVDYEYFTANSLKRKCKKRGFLGNHDRFIRDEKFRKNMFDVGRSEELCREMDKMANEDHSHHIIAEEISVYRNNWWTRSNTVGSDTMPVRHRADVKHCQPCDSSNTKKTQRWKSYSSSWWNWQESWWHSSYEHHHEDGPSKWLGYLFEVWFSEIQLVHNYISKFGKSQRSLLSPTVSVNTIPPIQQNLLQNGYDENKGYDESYENKCATNCSIITNNLERHAQQAAHNAQQVHQWRRWFRRLRGAHHALSLHIERTVPHLMMTPHTSWLKFWAITLSSPFIHGAFSLTRSLFSSFTGPSCPSPSSSSIPSCSLSSTTRSSWQVCATPPQMRVRDTVNSFTSHTGHEEDINPRTTTLYCEAIAECQRSRIDSETREPPEPTCSSTRPTTESII